LHRRIGRSAEVGRRVARRHDVDVCDDRGMRKYAAAAEDLID
jgi:hypothetical protein